MLDQAKSPRPGEELDALRIQAYLGKLDPRWDRPCVIKQFQDGASNLSYLIEIGNESLILRRPPFGTIAQSAHDMGREYQTMAILAPFYPYVPSMVALCEDTSVIGAPFYLMSRIEGVIFRSDLTPDIELSQGQARKLCHNLWDHLIKLHQIDCRQAPLSRLGKIGGYVQRQVEGWSKRYRAARTPDVPDFAEVIRWCDSAKPKADSATTIIHNDYRLDNVVLDPQDYTRIIGILDWEMATLGDPLMDLGNALAYWVEAADAPELLGMRRQPSHLAGMMTRSEIISYYLEQTGASSEHMLFYIVFGYFRLAGIAQQIYYRFYHGQTQDPRFAAFPSFINYLESHCQTLIQQANSWTVSETNQNVATPH